MDMLTGRMLYEHEETGEASIRQGVPTTGRHGAGEGPLTECPSKPHKEPALPHLVWECRAPGSRQ